MPIDWRGAHRCGDRERAVVAHAVADMTAEHERQFTSRRTYSGSDKSSTQRSPKPTSLSSVSIALRSICRRCRWCGR
jgi:hypothetical protein